MPLTRPELVALVHDNLASREFSGLYDVAGTPVHSGDVLISWLCTDFLPSTKLVVGGHAYLGVVLNTKVGWVVINRRLDQLEHLHEAINYGTVANKDLMLLAYEAISEIKNA